MRVVFQTTGPNFSKLDPTSSKFGKKMGQICPKHNFIKYESKIACKHQKMI